MWKTTDRYVQQKRVKAVEAELKLKQVYVPSQTGSGKGVSGSNISSPSSSSILSKNSSGSANIYNGTTNGGPDVSNIGKPCESCSILKSSQVRVTVKHFSKRH